MRAALSALAMTALLAATSAHAQQSPRLATQDKSFVIKAMSGGELEVQLGRLAQTNAARPEVKAFGQRMVDDHGANNQQLAAVAQGHDLVPPAKLPSAERREIDKLSRLHGEAFDRAYMAMMVDDHKHDIQEFRQEIDHGHNDDVKSYAQQTLPILEQHLQLAEDVVQPQGAAAEGR